jgi:hypothetical protein
MKHNTEILKSHLQQALRNTPVDFALSEVKGLIVQALNIVEVVESKRTGRQASKEARQAKITLSSNPHAALKAIESELETEKKKLQEINSRRSAPKTAENDENGIENVFG